MGRFRSTLVLTVICLGLFGYIYFYESKRQASPAEENPLAFVVQADAIEELTVAPAGGESSTLRKSEGGWDLVEPSAADADDVAVENLAQALASLEIQRVVNDNAVDLAQYGLAEPTVDVGFRAAGDTTPTHLMLGDKTPAGTEVYARTGDGNRVFLISGYLEGSFNKTPFDLRDKAILKFERDEVVGLDLAGANGAAALAKNGSDWTLSAPVRASADFSTVEGLIGQIHSGRMTSLTASETGDLSEYGLDRPVASATVLAGETRLTLEVGGPAPSGSVYARDVSRPLVFTIPQTLLTALDRAPSTYRRKDLFDFRSFNATTLEISRDGITMAFEKAEGDEPDANDGDVGSARWRQTAPEPKDIDAAALESLVAQLSALRIESYPADGTPTGLDSPVAEVAVTFDDGARQERVAFGRVDTGVYGARSDEPGAGVINETTFQSIMDGFDDFK